MQTKWSTRGGVQCEVLRTAHGEISRLLPLPGKIPTNANPSYKRSALIERAFLDSETLFIVYKFCERKYLKH